MLYYILRPIATLAYKIFYRKIHLIGVEKLPKDRPLLVACNHPNGFTEPCVLSCIFPISLNFMTRGDLFKNPIMRIFLRSTHQIPIFRFRDGFEAMRSNEKSIEEANKALLDNKAIIMFVEGSTQNTRKLRKFQKGLSRMTRDFELAYPDANLGILPVTINFSDPNNTGSSVTVSVYDVVEPKDFNFKENTSNAPLTQLTKQLHETMKEGVFHFENTENQDVFNSIIAKMPHKEFPSFLPKLISSDELLKRGKHLIQALEESDTYQKDFEEIANSKSAFLGQVNYSMFEKFMYFLLSPFALLGYLLNFIPLKSAFSFTKSKVKKPIFFTSVLIAINVAAYFLFVLTLIVFSLVFHFPIYITLAIFAIFSFIYVYFSYLKSKKQAAEDFHSMGDRLKSAYLKTQKIMENGIA